MKRGIHHKRGRLWAWVYATVFGVEQDQADEEHADDSERADTLDDADSRDTYRDENR